MVLYVCDAFFSAYDKVCIHAIPSLVTPQLKTKFTKFISALYYSPQAAHTRNMFE